MYTKIVDTFKRVMFDEGINYIEDLNPNTKPLKFSLGNPQPEQSYIYNNSLHWVAIHQDYALV